jgi:hypothetical protein
MRYNQRALHLLLACVYSCRWVPLCAQLKTLYSVCTKIIVSTMTHAVSHLLLHWCPKASIKCASCLRRVKVAAAELEGHPVCQSSIRRATVYRFCVCNVQTLGQRQQCCDARYCFQLCTNAKVKAVEYSWQHMRCALSCMARFNFGTSSSVRLVLDAHWAAQLSTHTNARESVWALVCVEDQAVSMLAS